MKIGEIYENNVQDLLQLEQKEAERLMGIFKELTGEMLKKMNTWSFIEDFKQERRYTAAKYRNLFAELGNAIAKLIEKYDFVDEKTLVKLKELSAKHLNKEIALDSEVFKGTPIAINWDVIVRSMNPKKNLLDTKEASRQAYSQATRKRYLRSIQKSLILQETQTEAADRLEVQGRGYRDMKDTYKRDPETILDMEWATTKDWEELIKREKGLRNFTSRFFEAERWRINRILRTEMHFIYNDSKLSGMKKVRDKYNPKMKKSLYHPQDNRTADDSKQLKVKNPVIDMDKPFKFTYEYKRKDGTVKQYHRQFDYPPDRPNDRSILIPIWVD